ncbi:MAG TPA: sigma-70 family RNA polymerase sigma factor, partial [Candidatus Hydrogenedentes bacterium]|nr:sigma-70 family RNA polymerase sigma factor [Candidatus Hydrogenedentota bacterium]
MLSLSESSDAGLVRETLGGKVDAFGVLVRRYFRVVHAVAYTHTGNAADAEDAAQEAFIRAYKSLDKLEKCAKFGSWLTTIARNAAISLVAARQRERDVVSKAERLIDEAAAPDLSQREMYGLVRARVMDLDPVFQEVLMLHYFAVKSTREIAKLLDSTQNAVKKRLERGRKALGERLLAEIGADETAQKQAEDSAGRVVALIASTQVPWEVSGAATAGATAMAGLGIVGGTVLVKKAVICIAAVLAILLGVYSAREIHRRTATPPAPADLARQEITTPRRRETAPQTALPETGMSAEPEPAELRQEPILDPDSQENEKPSGGVVSGRVYEADTGKGIGGMIVTVSLAAPDAETYASYMSHGIPKKKTDDMGDYIIEGLPEGETDLRCVTTGTPWYPRDAEFRRVMIRLGEAVSDVDFGVSRGLSISGVVVDAAGAPVPETFVFGRGGVVGRRLV